VTASDVVWFALEAIALAIAIVWSLRRRGAKNSES
jgi:cytochrome oxidase assembly protein ShyY1